jgi:hypothetical protein
MRKLAALAALLPSVAWAAPKLPPWTLVDNNACYSFDDAKKLKVFEAECGASDGTAAQLRYEVAGLKNQIVLKDKAYATLQLTIPDLDGQLKKAQAERDAAVTKAVQADGRSITGGGLPWVIAIGATALVVGIVAGRKL